MQEFVETAKGQEVARDPDAPTVSGNFGMKLIRSVVDPDKVDPIKNALVDLEVFGITLTDVRDYVPQKLQTVIVWRGRRVTSNFFARVEIDVTVEDDDVDAVVDVIMWNMRMSQPMKPAPSGEMMNHQMN